MKERPGRDLVIYGSADLVSGFMKLGLIDEYHIFVQPIVLGKVRPQFKDLNERYKLKLIVMKPFKSGAVGLFYELVSDE
jgi:dihydrofolate reductase